MDKSKSGTLVIETQGAWSEGTSSGDRKHSISYSPSSPDQTFLEAFQAVADIAQQCGVRDVQRLLQQVEQRTTA